MTTIDLDLAAKVSNLGQSVVTADYARNALAREVAHWVSDHRLVDDLGIVAQFLAAEKRFFVLQREYNAACGLQRGNGARP